VHHQADSTDAAKTEVLVSKFEATDLNNSSSLEIPPPHTEQDASTNPDGVAQASHKPCYKRHLPLPYKYRCYHSHLSLLFMNHSNNKHQKMNKKRN
jgi:hypothetical protein